MPPQHLVAWQQSVDTAGVLTAHNNVQDDVLTRTGVLRFLVQQGLDRIWWAAALGANLTRAQVIAPSLLVRRMSPEIAPRRRGAEAFSAASPEIWIPPRPLVLVAGEELEFDAAEDAVGVGQQDGFVSLGPAVRDPMPDGDIRMVRATGTTTLTARAWTSVTLTLDLSLQAGVYALVGFVAMSATAIAARAIITGQNPRPGLPAFQPNELGAVDFEAALFNQVMYTDMGHFSHLTVPQIQFFASAADTAETVYLYVVRIGDITAAP